MHNVLMAIRSTAERDPARIAISAAEEKVTYGELAARIESLAQALSHSPSVVGLLLPRGISYIVADLALASLGRTIVPLPDFFSIDQWRHIIADSGIEAVLAAPPFSKTLSAIGVPLLRANPDLGQTAATSPRSRRIIYTSGTTGAPKGVLLEEAAIAASLTGLANAVLPTADDVHLSVLPFSLLLEQLAGILLPLSVGARIHIAASPQSAAQEAEAVQPTTTVLVPDFLANWVEWLRQNDQSAPPSLRFVAVGGAPVSPHLADAAWCLGLPVYEGYGLSECCSVVAVNRPGQRRVGTVGRPLDTVEVIIDEGEIVVRGPTVMSGYLGGTPLSGEWRTGDMGCWDADGNLLVHGRKDDLVVTPNGRNVHPEWIEPMLLADPRILKAAIIPGDKGLKAVLLTDDPRAPNEWLLHLQDLTAAAPLYARPTEIAVISVAQARSAGLFTADGRPRRKRIRQFLAEQIMRFHDELIETTTPQRQAFMAIPLIVETIANGVDPRIYLAFLHSAYHHVRHTVPLMQAALAACGPNDQALADGLISYIAEETGHEEWILDDIAALGGDDRATRQARPPLAVRAMVAYAYRLIAEDGPYALLGMVHVLEGMSVALAIKAAQAIQSRMVAAQNGGFSYLTSHGGLDGEHVQSFMHLLDSIDSPQRRATVIAAAKDFYALYGDVFRALSPIATASHHAA